MLPLPLVPQPTEALLRRLVESQGAVPLSFELFPPRTEARRTALLETVDRLAPVAGEGFSVTMGAGGTTRTGTQDTAVSVARRSGRPVTAHLTALGLSREEALSAADKLWHAGITRILALRGDRPRVVQGPLPPGFAHAADLVAALRGSHGFEIAVAAYPEKHPRRRRSRRTWTTSRKSSMPAPARPTASSFWTPPPTAGFSRPAPGTSSTRRSCRG